MKIDKHRMKLKDFGITKGRYMELKGFCRQYPDWKRELTDHAYVSSPSYKMAPGNPNKGTTDMTGNTAVKLYRYERNVELIESVAKEAFEEVWMMLIQYVTGEEELEDLMMKYEIPMSKSLLKDRTRFFFYLLDLKKEE